MNFKFSLFDIYKYDPDCWGCNILEIGLMDRALFGLNSDEDGWYVNILWLEPKKVKRKW